MNAKQDAKAPATRTAARRSATTPGLFATLAALLRPKGSGAPTSRLLALTGLALTGLLLAAAPASADFGISTPQIEFHEADGSQATQAGSHPYALDIFFEVNRHEEEGQPFVDGGDIKDLLFEQARGFVGSTTAVPRCSTIDFATIVNHEPSCPDQSAVGVSAATITDPNPANALPAAVYNLTPPPGVPARLGFVVQETPVVLDIGVKPEPDYNVVGGPVNIPQPLTVFSSAFELWGEPSDPAHDFARGHCVSYALPSAAGVIVEGRLNFQHEGPECAAAGAPRIPFLTLPRTCTALQTAYRLDPWNEPGAFRTGSVPTGPFEGCGKLEFNPSIQSKATASDASSGAGLDFELSFEDPVDHSGRGLVEPGGIAQSDMKRIEVTLPQGVTANPSLAEGLEVCTPADLGRETLAAQPGEGCPNGSKIGTVAVQTPLVEEEITGNVFIASSYENPFNSLLAFYIVLRNKNLGILVKVPAKIEPDPQTGQLRTIVDETPQFPFNRFTFHFREGQRAPLITPPTCGTYTTTAKMTPWARPGETITKEASFQITRGVNGGACPSGSAPFNPGFTAGTLNNAAGSYSPFEMRITRGDGEQDITKFSSILPPGVVGKIAGVAQCPESGIAQAASRTGAHGGTAELADPSCPAASQIGTTLAGAGVGSALTYVKGFLYLAGPYHGDPLSVVSITPAVAGPFDAGAVVVRIALTLNPLTGEVEADGSASDPIPHILQGIPLNVRDLRVQIDKPEFTLNATSCEEEQTKATLFGGGTVLAPTGDTPVALAARYQAADCQALGFAPKLGLKLKGSKKNMKRSGHPALTAVLTPKPGDANLKATTVLLPHSMFIDQFHISNPCTRVQYAEGAGQGANCPAGSILGTVKAWTPLLDNPLEGKIYFRTNGGERELPDVVLNLNGQFHIEQVGFVDSKHERLRTRFASVPDAPISRVVLKLFGGKRGLLENSANLCASKQKARVSLAGQNGRKNQGNTVIQTPTCKSKKGKRHARHSRRR